MSNSHILPRERHVLASSHDFTVVAYDTEREERTDSNGIKVTEHVPTKAHDFAVSRDVLERVPYFRAILAPRGLRDTGKDFHELHEDDPPAWKIWLQILYDTVNADSYEVGIATVWNVLVIADKYELSPKREAAKGWFACWYKRWGDPETVDDCSEALYPCHTFDHPRGFARATKLLAYENEGHICEQMPLDGQIYHLRLDNRITQQLNAARGRLRTIIYRELYAPARKMLAAGDSNHCQYKEKVLWAYLKALEETSVWPSERVAHNKSIDSILSRLRRFEWSDPHPDGAKCTTCVPPGGFERAVKGAIELTRTYFDGLCLDCMNFAKTGDKDQDYWKYLSSSQGRKFSRGYHGAWDESCRVRHKEPSWYFSFMGSRKVFDEWRFARDEETD